MTLKKEFSSHQSINYCHAPCSCLNGAAFGAAFRLFSLPVIALATFLPVLAPFLAAFLVFLSGIKMGIVNTTLTAINATLVQYNQFPRHSPIPTFYNLSNLLDLHLI